MPAKSAITYTVLIEILNNAISGYIISYHTIETRRTGLIIKSMTMIPQQGSLLLSIVLMTLQKIGWCFVAWEVVFVKSQRYPQSWCFLWENGTPFVLLFSPSIGVQTKKKAQLNRSGTIEIQVIVREKRWAIILWVCNITIQVVVREKGLGCIKYEMGVSLHFVFVLAFW